MFATSADAAAVFLWGVPPSLRPIALAVSDISNHVLGGDIPFPPLLGFLQQHFKNWRFTMSACAATFGVSALLFCSAVHGCC